MTRSSPHTAVGEGDTVAGQPPGVLGLVPRHEPAGSRDHPPPWDVVLLAVPEQVPDRPRRAGVAGLLGHLTVGHDVTPPQPAEDAEHVVFESHRVIVPDRG